MNITKKIILNVIGISFLTSCLFLNINIKSYAKTITTTTKKTTITSKQKKSNTKKPIAKKTPIKVVKKVPTKVVKKAPAKIVKKTPVKQPVKVIEKTVDKTEAKEETSNNSTVTIEDKEKTSTVEQLFTINSMEDLFTYINTKSTNKIDFKNIKVQKTYDKAKEILGMITSDKMTEFEREKAIHDYIVTNVKLSTENSESKNSYEALVDNTSGAYGYAEAIKLLLNLSKIECTIVNGEYANADGINVKHSWNLVKLDGKDYHLDAAFDNNINIQENMNKNEYINYDNFNVCDNTIESNHIWDKTKYTKAENQASDLVVGLLNDMATGKAPVQIKGDWLYFANENTQGKLTKCKFDGTSSIMLFEDAASVSYMEVSNKWLVYCSDYIYKLNLETNERSKISQSMADFASFNTFSVENENLYYLENTEDEKYFIYKMNLNSMEKILLLENPLPIMNFFKVINGELYYFITEEGNSGLVKMKLTDKTTSKIIEGEPVNIEISKEWIYFTIVDVSTVFDEKGAPDQTKTVSTNYKCDLNGASKEQIGEPMIKLKAVVK